MSDWRDEATLIYISLLFMMLHRKLPFFTLDVIKHKTWNSLATFAAFSWLVSRRLLARRKSETICVNGLLNHSTRRDDLLNSFFKINKKLITKKKTSPWKGKNRPSVIPVKNQIHVGRYAMRGANADAFILTRSAWETFSLCIAICPFVLASRCIKKFSGWSTNVLTQIFYVCIAVPDEQ